MVQVEALDDGRYAARRRRHPPDPRQRLAARRPVPAGRRRRLARRRRRRRRGLADGVADARRPAAATCSTLAGAARRGARPTSTSATISDDPLVASLPPRRAGADRPGRPLPPAVRPTPAERLDLLAEALDDVEAMLRFRLGGADRAFRVPLGVIEPPRDGARSSHRLARRRDDRHVDRRGRRPRQGLRQAGDLGPLKGAGRWLAMGAAGAVLLGLGLSLLAARPAPPDPDGVATRRPPARCRGSRTSSSSSSAVLLIVLVVSRINRDSLNKEPK